MKIPINTFKTKLVAGSRQIGIWSTLPGGYVVEILAGAGFDWIVLDTEHSPGDVLTILPQLQTIAAYDVEPVVRIAENDPGLIRRFLDIGAQTLLVPFVETPLEAQAAVAAMRFPPRGTRGVAGVTRASRFGRAVGYARRAEEELCLLVQIESILGVTNIEAIAAVDGVDGILIGFADLAASMGFTGQPRHPEVVALAELAFSRLLAVNKPVGTSVQDIEFARRCIALGSSFTAVGADGAILARETEKLAAAFRGPAVL